MSLRGLGVFAPLKADHPLVTGGKHCRYCDLLLTVGVRVALVAWHTADETGERCVEAKVVCATCGLRGREITTPIGRRIAQYVRDGECEFLAVTTDGSQWRDEEVTP